MGLESLGSGLPAGVAAHPPFVLKSDSPPYTCYSLPLPLIGCTGSRCILTILFLYVSQLVSLVSLDFSCFPPFPLLRSRSSREFWPRGYNAVASKRSAPARRTDTIFLLDVNQTSTAPRCRPPSAYLAHAWWSTSEARLRDPDPELGSPRRYL